MGTTVIAGICRSGLFKSVTITHTAPGEKPVADTCKFTCWLPSAMPSFMVVIGISTEAAPDGMVAVAGKVTSVRSVDKRSTVNGWVVGVFLVMVSVPAFAEPSANVIGLADSCREGPSLSLMVILADT